MGVVAVSLSVSTRAHELVQDSPVLGRILILVVVFVIAALFVSLVNWLLSIVYWRRLTRNATPEAASELRRSQRQQTVLTTFQGLVRYLAYGFALIGGVALVAEGVASLVVVSSLIGVLVAFGFQRLLTDVIAGALILFDRQFSVGDFIEVHQPYVAGFVEEFTLRTTVLRTLTGDRAVVLNGSITVCSRAARGGRTCRLECMAHGTAAELREPVAAALTNLAQSPTWHFIAPPALVAIDPLPGTDIVRLEISMVVAPTTVEDMTMLVRDHLALALGPDVLMGEVRHSTIVPTAFDGYRANVPVVQDV